MTSIESSSAIVTLRGKVVDQFGAPVSGASLTIKRAYIIGSTRSDGGFTMSEVATSAVSFHATVPHAAPPKLLPGGSIEAFVPKNISKACVDLFTLQGKLVFSQRFDHPAEGVKRFTLNKPLLSLGNQLYIVRLKLGVLQYTFSITSMKGTNIQGLSGLTSLGNAGETGSHSAALRKTTATAPVDTLIIHKALYQNDSVPFQAYTGDLGVITVTKTVADTALCGRISPDSLFRTGLNAFNAGNFNMALAYFSQYIQRYPSAINGNDVRYYYGQSWFLELGYDSAIVQFNAFLLARPASTMRASAQVGIGDCNYYKANVDTTLAAWNTALYNQALTAYNAVLTSYPSAAEASHAQENIGQSYYFLKNYTLAESNLLKVPGLYPSCPDAPNAEYYIGRCRMNASDYANALTRFNTVLTKYPTSTKCDNCLYWAGRTYYLQGNYTAANAKFIACLTQYPGSSYVDNSYYWGGLCYAKSGDCVNAKKDLSSMQLLYPSSSSLTKAKTYITAICP